MPPTTGFSAALDTNDLIMSYIPEATWGTTPDNPAWQNIRLDGEGFSSTKNRTRPNEIDPSGQASAAITVKEESTGSLNFSVSAGLASNVLIASSMNGVWTTPVSYAGSDVAVTVANGKTGTLTATAGAFTTTNLIIPGQMIKLYSAGSAANSGIFRVLTVAASQLTFDCHSGTPTVADAATMGACTIKGSCLRNGTTINTFTFQKKQGSALFLRYPGSFPTGGSLDVGTGEYLKGTMSFLNKEEVSATSEIAGSSYTSAPTRTVIDSVNGIGIVWRNGAIISAIIQKTGVKWNKENSAAQYGMGSAAAVGMRSGKLLYTGTLSSYFKDFSLYNEFKNEVGGPISYYAIDGSPAASGTKGYVFTYTNATIMNPKIVNGGPGQDVVADFEIEGNPGSSTLYAGKTFQIDYFD